MQSHHDGWEPMENGAAGHVWKPRKTAAAAVLKCVTWTGGIGIPAMRVIDLDTGLVVWAQTKEYPEAGLSVPLTMDWLFEPERLPQGALFS